MTTPSTFKPKQEAVLCLLAEGASITEAAAANGVDRTTIHYWLKHNPAYASALLVAREAFCSRRRQVIRQSRMAKVSGLDQTIKSPQASAAARSRAALAALDWRPSKPSRFDKVRVNYQDDDLLYQGNAISDAPGPSNRIPDAFAPDATPTTRRQHRVLQALAAGAGIKEAAAAAHVSRSTIYQWALASPVFTQAVARARAQARQEFYDTALPVAQSAMTAVEDLMGNPKIPPQVRLTTTVAVLKALPNPKPGSTLDLMLNPVPMDEFAAEPIY